MDTKKIGNFLKNKRTELGYTLEEVANKLNVSKQAISLWELGNVKRMKRENIENLSKLYNISPLKILGYEDNEIEEKQETLIPEDLDTSILSVQQKADLEAILSMNLGLFMKDGLEVTEYDKKQIRYSLTKLYLEKIKEMK